jgi:hypothetical protein
MSFGSISSGRGDDPVPGLAGQQGNARSYRARLWAVVTLRLHMGVGRSATDPMSASRRDADLRRSRRTCPPLTQSGHAADEAWTAPAGRLTGHFPRSLTDTFAGIHPAGSPNLCWLSFLGLWWRPSFLRGCSSCRLDRPRPQPIPGLAFSR